MKGREIRAEVLLTGTTKGKGMILFHNVRDSWGLSAIIELHLASLPSTPNLNHQFDNIAGANIHATKDIVAAVYNHVLKTTIKNTIIEELASKFIFPRILIMGQRLSEIQELKFIIYDLEYSMGWDGRK